MPSAEEQDQCLAFGVLHLSDGQVIWSGLDSLRAIADEDSESLFRKSMASPRGSDVSDNIELRSIELNRWDLKEYNYSQRSHLSRGQEPGQHSSGLRLETKV